VDTVVKFTVFDFSGTITSFSEHPHEHPNAASLFFFLVRAVACIAFTCEQRTDLTIEVNLSQQGTKSKK